MQSLGRIALGAIAGLFLLAAQTAQAQVLLDPERGVFSLHGVLAPIMPGVVQVLVDLNPEAAGRRPQQGNPFADPDQPPPDAENGRTGSGAVIDAERGLIVTNHHVVENAAGIVIRLSDGRELEAELVGSDQSTDIALVRVSERDLTQLPFGDSDSLKVGDFVIAIGYPLGLEQTVTLGIVSGLSRQTRNLDYEDFIQTDAAINSGNSGGPLVDTQGRIVGINTLIVSEGGGNIGLGFAVSERIVRAVVQQLEEYGEVRRGRIGVSIEDLTPDVAEALSLDVSQGAMINEVHANTPGLAAGLRAGDIVVAANGEPIESARDLRNFIGLAGPNATITLRILRDGKEQALEVKLEPPSVRARDLHLFGASLAPLPESHIAAQRGVRGFLITDVEPDSPAATADLQSGDVVEYVNQHPVDSLKALREELSRVKGVAVLDILRGNRVLRRVVRQHGG